MGKKDELQTDFVHLARIALSGRTQDVQALLHRIARRNRETKSNLSDQLVKLLREAPTRASPLRRDSNVAMPVDSDTRMQLLQLENKPSLDHEPVFTPEVGVDLHRLVEERLRPQLLFDVGLEPTRTALFIGPPGVGKTMAARWLAREIGRPLVILDLAAVMSSYLGRTGNNLRYVLDYAKSNDCILLVDELDAVAKRRDDREEVGELKRLVTVLIQQIDDWPSSSLLIAATNHSELLDPAIWRRFESTIDFPIPSLGAAESFINACLKNYIKDSSVWGSILSLAFQGLSFSDIEIKLNTARRASALNGKSLDDHLISLIQPRDLHKRDRIKLATEIVKQNLTSQRRAAELTGVARDTIRNRNGENIDR